MQRSMETMFLLVDGHLAQKYFQNERTNGRKVTERKEKEREACDPLKSHGDNSVPYSIEIISKREPRPQKYV